MNVVRLAPSDRSLLAARFAQHGNSHRRMKEALGEAGADVTVGRIEALRRIELRFGIDLGSVCHRHARRDRPDTHPIERMVMAYITEIRGGDGGSQELWVLLDRVAEIRALTEGRLVGEPES